MTGPGKDNGRGEGGATAPASRVFFLTGYPGFIGRRLAPALLARHTDARLLALVRDRDLAEARAAVKDLGPADEARVTVLVGDVADVDLGLSGPEVGLLTRSVTDVFHLAALYWTDANPAQMRRVNVDGTRRVLELCREMTAFSRLHHVSTAFVCGERTGVVAEDELQMGQRFRNAYEQTKYEAEVMVRDAMATIPATVYRPAIVVGDSRTGETERFDGVYELGLRLFTTPLAVPMPGEGSAPFNVVPIDFVVEALVALVGDPAAAGRTLHLVDPNPMSTRRIFEQVARRAGRRPPRPGVSSRLTEAVLRLPLVDRVARTERMALDYADHMALFSHEEADALLSPHGVRCPPLSGYLDRLITFVQETWRARQEADEAATEDPLDTPAGPPG